MTKLSDTHYLKRASGYSAPLNGNDRLPIVYGDLTDGSKGIWTLPCLNDDGGGMNPVYCFAAHETLSVANGNSITIYEENQELNPALYTFDESNDYEGHGVISTITFTSPKANAIITAKGMGKPTISGGATLMENIIDIIYNFLTEESDFASALFESTAKAKASQIFTGQGYQAAGVIDQDSVIWEIITAMMGSFIGSAYLNGMGELILDIDNNTIPDEQVPIIRRGDGILTDAKIRLENIINQCPCNYAYDYTIGDFKSHTDELAHADLISQGIFGVRKPNTPYQFYWCRDLTSIQTMEDLIVAKLKNPLFQIEIEDITLKRMEIDIGNFIAFSADRLYGLDGSALLNNYWKILSVRPDIVKNRIRFSALQMEKFMTVAYLADGSHLADGSIKAGGDRDTTTY